MDVPSTCQIPGLEAFYYGIFGEKRDGTFVEVGAHDGITYSNTWPLAVNGWAGLYVEPIPEFANQCRGNHARHPRVFIEECAIGAVDGVELALHTNGQGLFTGSKEVGLLLGAGESVYIRVEQRTLDSLLHQYSDIIEDIDLLVVDVEGMELKVLAGFNVPKYLPTMIIIEAHEQHHLEAMRFNAKEINELLYHFGYTRIYSDDINNIYLQVYKVSIMQEELWFNHLLTE
jgi:FkbM family methyltransferase